MKERRIFIWSSRNRKKTQKVLSKKKKRNGDSKNGKTKVDDWDWEEWSSEYQFKIRRKYSRKWKKKKKETEKKKEKERVREEFDQESNFVSPPFTFKTVMFRILFPVREHFFLLSLISPSFFIIFLLFSQLSPSFAFQTALFPKIEFE